MRIGGEDKEEIVFLTYSKVHTLTAQAENSAMNRRNLLKNTIMGGGAAFLSRNPIRPGKNIDPSHPFTYCLNTSCIMGQDVGLQREIEIAAEAGFDGIEIWIRSIDRFVEEGGDLKELRLRIEDLDIRIENAIGFAQWIIDDNDGRSQALAQARKEMDLLSQLGCERIAAPPAGATQVGGLDLDVVAERFRAICELGDQMGVTPQLEVWGFSANLSRLAEVLYVAAACGHPRTRILPDAYHLYKGGSDFDGLKLLSKEAVEIFHINDYPADPPRLEIGDADRVYPGQGIAPLDSILTDLAGPRPTVLSLELFNRDYWQADPLEVAKTGLAAMRAAVANAMG